MERTKFRIIFGVLTTSLALLSLTARADIFNVPDDFETIQEATENAENGDTIMVAPGEYSRAAGFVREPSPIWFIGDPNHETIVDLGGDRHNGFSSQYARIFVENFVIRNNSGGRPGVGLFRTHGEVRNCVFQDLSVGITISEGSALIERCRFENNAWNTHLDLNEDETIFRYNSINECTFGIDIGYGRSALIENNTIVNTPNAIIVRGSEGLCHIKNNIIFGNEVAVTLLGGFLDNQIIDEFVAQRLAISYNCLWNNEMNFLAVLDDTTDVFNPSPGDGIIDENPLFVDPDNGDYHLNIDSPCIDAGAPDSPIDPYGTRTDMGAFYFHQRDIDVDPDTLEFIGIQTGTVDSLAVIVRNVGLTILNLTSVGIASFNAPLDVDEIEEALPIEPDSSYTIWVRFLPFEENQYLANLIIESDDPDEATVEVLISATALSVSDDIQAPLSFGIAGIYPNPFNAATTITYQLPHPSNVSLTVYNLCGRKVGTLVDEQLAGGIYNTTWQPDNLTSGLYFVRLGSGDRMQMRKVVLIR